MQPQQTIFSKIINREIPAKIVYESETVLAFHDVNPQAPVHILVIPKKHIVNLAEVADEDRSLMGDLMAAIQKIAAQEGLIEPGFRVVANSGEAAGQSVFHLHFHILSGRPFAWPPG